MASFDILLVLLPGIVMLAVLAGMRNELIGGYRILSWMKRRWRLLKERGQKSSSKKEKQAIHEILTACDSLRNISFNKWNFKSAILSLIKKIAFIYHPNATVPIEQARLKDVLEALKDANQKFLHVIHLPLGQNKVMELVNKYQVGSIAKWSHTLYKTLQNK